VRIIPRKRKREQRKENSRSGTKEEGTARNGLKVEYSDERKREAESRSIDETRSTPLLRPKGYSRSEVKPPPEKGWGGIQGASATNFEKTDISLRGTRTKAGLEIWATENKYGQENEQDGNGGIPQGVIVPLISYVDGRGAKKGPHCGVRRGRDKPKYY